VLSFLKSLSDAILSAVTLQNLAILSFIEAIFFPVPPDALLMPLVLKEPSVFLTAALVTTAFSVLGAIAGYGLGSAGGRPILDRFASTEKIARVEELYQRYDMWSIFVGAFTPIPYKVFAVSAGVFRLSLVRFTVASIIGRFARFFLIAVLVAAYGQSVVGFVERYFGPLTLIAAFLALLFWWYWRSVAKRRSRTA